MTPGGLITLLGVVADECEHVAVPSDPFERDALYDAALRANEETLALARRISKTQRVGRWRRRRL